MHPSASRLLKVGRYRGSYILVSKFSSMKFVTKHIYHPTCGNSGAENTRTSMISTHAVASRSGEVIKELKSRNSVEV